MPTLVSAGVSVTIEDESFYIPASASTVPLFILATRADKLQPDGVTAAAGALENNVVRTITSLNQSVTTYGVPHFRTTGSAQHHGDARNEYGLFALNQYLSLGNLAYTVRANVDLADAPVITWSASAPAAGGGNVGNGTVGSLTVDQNTAVAETWTLTATNATTFTVDGSVSAPVPNATVGTPYSNGIVSFTITAGGTAFQAGDTFTFTVSSSTQNNPLGATDALRRTTIVSALASVINSNMDIRSDLYEYNILCCPGYHEVVDELLALNDAIGKEAFIVADTPFNKTPEETATWSLTVDRRRSENVSYYYPHCLASNLDGVEVFGAASGVALKAITYSDNVSEVWMPPAGFRRGNVTGVANIGYVTGTLGAATTFVAAPLNQGQRDALYDFNKNVNPISFFPGRGITVFGQKTSYNVASALDRINVVRLLNKMKRDIRKASMSFLFELNDRITRETIKAMIDDYLSDILQRRGLYDYVVQCDEQNNTAVRIDRNELWVDIAVKPAKAVEFIYIPIRVVTTGADL